MNNRMKKTNKNTSTGMLFGMVIGFLIGAAKDKEINNQIEEKGYTIKNRTSIR